jgi:hypothetical protein
MYVEIFLRVTLSVIAEFTVDETGQFQDHFRNGLSFFDVSVW